MLELNAKHDTGPVCMCVGDSMSPCSQACTAAFHRMKFYYDRQLNRLLATLRLSSVIHVCPTCVNLCEPLGE